MSKKNYISRKQKTSGQVLDAWFCFIRAMFSEAYTDTPAEIHKWCRSENCRFLASFLDIDLNEYERQTISKSIAYHSLTGIKTE